MVPALGSPGRRGRVPSRAPCASTFPSHGGSRRCHVPRGMAGSVPRDRVRSGAVGPRWMLSVLRRVCPAPAAAPLQPLVGACVCVGVHAGGACSRVCVGRRAAVCQAWGCVLQECWDAVPLWRVGAPAGRQLRGSGQCPRCPPELPWEAAGWGTPEGDQCDWGVEELDGLAWLGGTDCVCCLSCCRYLASWLLPPIMGPL